jgi:hypothetical protein
MPLKWPVFLIFKELIDVDYQLLRNDMGSTPSPWSRPAGQAGCVGEPLCAAYDLTLNFSEGQQYDGLFPASFGTAPRRAALAGTALDAGVSQSEFDQVDAEVAAAVALWPEFAAAAGLPDEDRDRAARIHTGLAESLGMEVPVTKRKRRKLW